MKQMRDISVMHIADATDMPTGSLNGEPVLHIYRHSGKEQAALAAPAVFHFFVTILACSIHDVLLCIGGRDYHFFQEIITYVGLLRQQSVFRLLRDTTTNCLINLFLI